MVGGTSPARPRTAPARFAVAGAPGSPRALIGTAASSSGCGGRGGSICAPSAGVPPVPAPTGTPMLARHSPCISSDVYRLARHAYRCRGHHRKRRPRRHHVLSLLRRPVSSDAYRDPRRSYLAHRHHGQQQRMRRPLRLYLIGLLRRPVGPDSYRRPRHSYLAHWRHGQQQRMRGPLRLHLIGLLRRPAGPDSYRRPRHSCLAHWRHGQPHRMRRPHRLDVWRNSRHPPNAEEAGIESGLDRFRGGRDFDQRQHRRLRFDGRERRGRRCVDVQVQVAEWGDGDRCGTDRKHQRYYGSDREVVPPGDRVLGHDFAHTILLSAADRPLPQPL